MPRSSEDDIWNARVNAFLRFFDPRHSFLSFQCFRSANGWATGLKTFSTRGELCCVASSSPEKNVPCGPFCRRVKVLDGDLCSSTLRHSIDHPSTCNSEWWPSATSASARRNQRIHQPRQLEAWQTPRATKISINIPQSAQEVNRYLAGKVYSSSQSSSSIIQLRFHLMEEWYTEAKTFFTVRWIFITWQRWSYPKQIANCQRTFPTAEPPLGWASLSLSLQAKKLKIWNLVSQNASDIAKGYCM